MNNAQVENQILQVPIEDVLPNRFQPRLAFDDSSLTDLAASIKEHGIIQPLILRRKNDKYEIIAGERRFKAAKMAGLLSVPAVISNLDDFASAEVAIVENIQRKDLTSIEEARSYQSLLDKGYMTQEKLARKMGLSQSAISNKLRLLSLDESVQDAILAEKISERHARTLLKVPSHEKQKELVNKIINERLTVKQLEDEIKNMEFHKVDEIPYLVQEEKREEMQDNNISNLNNIFTDVSDLEDISFDQAIDEIKDIPTTTPQQFFSNPESMPNKFFNFLEDTAVNMGTEEITPTFEIPKVDAVPNTQDLLTNTDNIEMLDDFLVPEDNVNENNDYLNDIIKTIRQLHLDSDKVKVEEMNLPNEYHINIVIKKSD